MKGLLAVVGTDTGVGKTVVASGLIQALRESGLRVAGFKPVETGLPSAEPVPGDGARPDWQRLEEASGQPPGTALGAAFVLPAAPLAAAREAGVTLDVADLDSRLDRLRRTHDVVVVEGAGGLEVPLAPGVLWGDLLARWAPACLVVAHLGLGTINHTLLTLEGLRRRGLEPLGVLLNETTRPGPEVHHTPVLIAEFGVIAVFGALPSGTLSPQAVAQHLQAVGVMDRVVATFASG